MNIRNLLYDVQTVAAGTETATTAWTTFLGLNWIEYEQTEPWEDERGLIHYPHAWFQRQGGQA